MEKIPDRESVQKRGSRIFSKKERGNPNKSRVLNPGRELPFAAKKGKRKIQESWWKQRDRFGNIPAEKRKKLSTIAKKRERCIILRAKCGE